MVTVATFTKNYFGFLLGLTLGIFLNQIFFDYCYIFTIIHHSLAMEAWKDDSNALGILLPNGSWTGMRGQLQRSVNITIKLFITVK